MRAVVACAVALVLVSGAGAAARRPLALVQPTSLELEPAGTILIVENNPGRILRFDPRSGRVAVLAQNLVQPYAIVRSPAGAIFYSTSTSTGGALQRLGGRRTATSRAGLGPLAVDLKGAVYYASSTGVFRAGGGRLAPREHFSNPHGLAVARDGSLVVSDTGNNRVVRIDPRGKATTFAQVDEPRGIDVARDGTVYVIDPVHRRVVHLSATGKRLRVVGPVLPGDPYALQVAADGSVYVLESGAVGDIRRIAPNGTARLL